MTTDDFTYKPQDINYLGFLEAQLRDMQGMATLAYELIQNADDARDGDGRPQATHITFDVTADALIVTNDGVFRPLDFARLQSIAGGGKRAEAGTTGAFGIGFIAVYQITDAPEIFSADTHWTIDPAAPPEQRIQERPSPTSGTRFRLPWAFDARSPVRRALRQEAVRPEQLPAFVDSLAAAISLAALFLQQLQVLEVRHEGRLVQRIARTRASDTTITLQDAAGQSHHWLLFAGDFDEEAGRLRAKFPLQIEKNRRGLVRLAIPTTPLSAKGRLFAVLPTAVTTPLPLHLNAEFFPTTDRKQVHLDAGYQAAWNSAALKAAARLLEANFDTLPAALGPAGLWHFLQQLADTNQLALTGDLPPIFATFWETVAPTLANRAIVVTAQGEWHLPAQVRLLPRGAADTAGPLVANLDIPLVDPILAPFTALLRRPEINTPTLSIADLVTALKDAGMAQPIPLHQAPPFLRSPDQWQALWQLVDVLLRQLTHPTDRDAARATLTTVPLVLTESMQLDRLGRVYRGRPEARTLFPDVTWVHDLVPEHDWPGPFILQFGVRQAVDLLAEMPPDQLEQAWRMGRVDLPSLWRWFEANQIEIFGDDPALAAEIRRLPLCPVAGELQPLTGLYIPGGFSDPLGLAGSVDLEALGGRRQFLQDLGVNELDFYTYVEELLPRALSQNPDLPSDGRHRLVQLLAARLGEIRDDSELQEQLSHLPLIPCLDGSFRAAAATYASRDVITLLGERVHIAEPVEQPAVEALHRWLGVRAHPTAPDIIQALLTIEQQVGAAGAPLARAIFARVGRCWAALSDLHTQEQLPSELLTPLARKLIIPNRQRILSAPYHLLWADDEVLADRFPELADHLLAPDPAMAEVLTVVGVRPLSVVATLHLTPPDETSPDPTIQTHIAGRGPLLARVLQADIPAKVSLQLDQLQVRSGPMLQFQYRLQLGDQTWTSAVESGPAQWIAATNTLYVAYDGQQVPWTAVARALAQAFAGERPTGGLAIGFREVLTAETTTAAIRLLDELGYP